MLEASLLKMKVENSVVDSVKVRTLVLRVVLSIHKQLGKLTVTVDAEIADEAILRIPFPETLISVKVREVVAGTVVGRPSLIKEVAEAMLKLIDGVTERRGLNREGLKLKTARLPFKVTWKVSVKAVSR